MKCARIMKVGVWLNLNGGLYFVFIGSKILDE